MKRTILLLFAPLLALGDPGSATRYLMNDPVSMLDLGIFRAEQYLERSLETRRKTYKILNDPSFTILKSNVFYVFDDDLIVFSAEIKGLEPDAETLEDECRSIVEDMRIIAKLLPIIWFSHEGFKRSGEPDKLILQIEDRMELRCAGTSTFVGADPLEPIVSVRSKLLDEEVFVTKAGDK